MGINWPKWGGKSKAQKALNPTATPNKRPITGPLTPLEYNYREDKAYSSVEQVYTVVSFLMQKFAAVPIRVYKIKDKAALKQFKYFQPHQYQSPANFLKVNRLQRKALEQVDENNDLARLLQQPNPNMTSDVFFQTLYGYKLLKGEGMIWLDRGPSDEGNPDKPVLFMQCLPPNLVDLVPDPADLYGILSWVFQMPQLREIPIEDLVQWRYPRFDFDATTRIHMRGQAPLTAGRNMLEGNAALGESFKSNYANKGANGVIVNQDPMMSYDEMQKYLSAINERINGPKNAGTIAGINGRDTTFFNLSVSAREMDYINAQKYSLSRVANLFNAPAGIWDLSESANNNISQYRAQVYTDKLMNEWADLCNMLNSSLLRPFGLQGNYYIGPDYSELPDLQADFQRRLSTLSAAWEITPNEKRELQGYELSSNELMDTQWVPSGFKPIDDAGLDIDQIEQDAITSMDRSTNNIG